MLLPLNSEVHFLGRLAANLLQVLDCEFALRDDPFALCTLGSDLADQFGGNGRPPSDRIVLLRFGQWNDEILALAASTLRKVCTMAGEQKWYIAAFPRIAFQREVSMDKPFDIFKKEVDGRIAWCSAATSIPEAYATIKRLDGANVEFIIVNEQTGERTIVKPEPLKQRASWSSEMRK